MYECILSKVAADGLITLDSLLFIWNFIFLDCFAAPSCAFLFFKAYWQSVLKGVIIGFVS